MRNRFVVGAGSSYSVSNTGGEATHTLTVAEMPSHTHEVRFTYLKGQDYIAGTGSGGGSGNWGLVGNTYGGQVYNVNTGGSQAHNNLPPYYALCYIMKI